MLSNRAFFLNHVAQTSPFPLGLEISHAKGSWLYSIDGKKYLDLISGIGVSVLGHSHPPIINAIKEQVDKHLHAMVYGEYVLAPQAQFAAKLIPHFPKGMDRVYFTNSGTEAVEGAMKLAKRFTGRSKFIALTHSYHGSTQGALSLQSDPTFKEAFSPLLPDINWMERNCDYCLNFITKETAAVICELVQAEAGIYPLDKSWLVALSKKCQEVGALLIFDEAQTGFGRTGEIFAYQKWGVNPDILVLAKGMAGGMPLGAFVARSQIMNSFMSQPILGHITTFGGHPVSCAAGLAVLSELENTDILAQVTKKERLFLAGMKHKRIKEVRSAGLMIAVELENFESVQSVIAHCLEGGLIIDWFLFNDKCLRIAPPLTISDEEIKWSCQIILEGLG
jgi:acetylornithine/succinyldiaminopimelate/putrescine aminotransferase